MGRRSGGGRAWSRAATRALGRLVLAVLALAAGACFDDPAIEEHVLSRIGYGPDPWSLARIRELGVSGYVEEQLHPQTIPDPELDSMLQAYPSVWLGISALYDFYGSGIFELGDSQQPRREPLAVAKLLRAVYGRRQLQAVLTDFWINHLNVDATNGVMRRGIVPYERESIRPHVLGFFEHMLMASARSPAMLDYLDNTDSYKDGVVVGGQERGINENYARELMELHTMGVDGPYTQEDVIGVARALTGWRLDWSWQNAGFQFTQSYHDTDEKVLFGGALVLPAGGGIQDGEKVLRYLARHPATAEHLSRELCKRFISETPPESLVQEAKAMWISSGGNLARVMEVILHSPELLTGAVHTKVKRPLHLVASVFRATGADLRGLSFDELQGIVGDIAAMGEPLYQVPPPTGLPESSGYFSGSGAMLDRFNFVHAFALDGPAYGIDWAAGIPSPATPEEVRDALIARLLPSGVAPSTLRRSLRFTNQLYAANVPREQRIPEVAGLLLASPEFLYH